METQIQVSVDFKSAARTATRQPAACSSCWLSPKTEYRVNTETTALIYVSEEAQGSLLRLRQSVQHCSPNLARDPSLTV